MVIASGWWMEDLAAWLVGFDLAVDETGHQIFSSHHGHQDSTMKYVIRIRDDNFAVSIRNRRAIYVHASFSQSLALFQGAIVPNVCGSTVFYAV